MSRSPCSQPTADPKLPSCELPHRVHCAHVYPLRAPNGANLIIYGHESGLRVLWRGGRRRKEGTTPSDSAPKYNGVSSGDAILIDGNDYEAPQQTAQGNEGNDSETEEEELDSDCPYPSIVQDLNIDMETAVLYVALTPLPAATVALAPGLLKSVALVTVASADGTIRVVQIPLMPPSADSKQEIIAEIKRIQIELSTSGPIPLDLATKITGRGSSQEPSPDNRSGSVEGELLVAVASRSLTIWTIPIIDGELTTTENLQLMKTPLPSTAIKLSFHPSSRATQLLLADESGTVRIYDVHASKASSMQPTSHDSAQSANVAPGARTRTYQTAFQSPGAAPNVPVALARRKQILSASWVLAGKAIFVLLEDGEWGIWDFTSSSQSNNKQDDFIIRGFLGSTTSTESTDQAKPKRGLTKLAPMTPNTRKAKAEDLFHGIPKVPGAASRGGISVASSIPRPRGVDESVIIWYDGGVYAITSMQSFWQRSVSGGGGFGSLYSPGLTHLSDINLMNENITAISQFNPNSSTLEQMSLQRDLVISAEHRLVILQSLRPQTLSRVLFEKTAERPTSRDQKMLDAGQLDIGGMDRMLDSMTTGDNRVRRVGFAR